MATLALIPIFAYVGGAVGGAAFGGTAAAAGVAATGGFAAGAAIGATLGAAAGSYIDQTYLYPLFTSPQHNNGARINDLPVQTASEGVGINFCFGAENRLAGTVIWLSDLIEVKVEDTQGGKGGGGGSVTSTTYDYYYHVAVAVCEGEIEDIDKIWADSKVIYDSSVTPPKDPRVHLVRIYKGQMAHPQDPDSLIESYMGAGSTPAFRGTAYVVFEGFYLKDWGNRLPNFTFQVRAQNHESVSGCISNILERANITFAEGAYNVDNVEQSIRGYNIAGIGSPLSAIEPITQAYDVLTQENNGVLVFFTRGREEVIPVNASDLCSFDITEGSANVPRPFVLTDTSGFDLPKEINIKYIDPTTDYQAGSQKYTRNDNVSQTVQEMNLPFVIAPRDAVNIAANRLWRSYAERMKVDFSLPPSYLPVQENDIVTIPWNGEVYSVRLMTVAVGNNFLLQCSGLLTGIELADEAVDCNGRLNSVSELTVPPPITQSTIIVALLDTSAVRDSETQATGIYIAATASSLQANLGSVSVYTSPDNVNWVPDNSIELNSKMGVTTTVLNPGDPESMDLVNTLEVVMYEGELVSVSEDALLSGANHMWVGSELIGYQNAELIAPYKYRISNLIRGRRVTPTAGHFANERCVLLNEAVVQFEPLSLSMVGSRRYLKFVQFGQDLADGPTFTIQFQGNTLKQLPPCHVVGVRDSISGDASLTWVRRTRALVKAFSSSKPLLATSESYVVEAYYNSVLIRTTTVTTPAYTYLGTDQAADGLVFLVPITFRIYQVNDVIGKGFYVEETI